MASVINNNQHSGYKQGMELKTKEGLGADGVNVITFLIKHLLEVIPQDTTDCCITMVLALFVHAFTH